MPRGGLRPNTKVESNHLFKPKWKNKKTTAIRIPEVFKDVLLGLARCLDAIKNSPDNNEVKIAIFNLDISTDENLHLLSFPDRSTDFVAGEIHELISDKPNQNKQKNQQNKYQLAVECFGEFVESQSLNVEELSKSRKGTKKHQLFEINQWLVEQSNNNK